MKILRNKNIFGLLFAVLLAIPMIDIAVRCIYVQSNKNAKDSYSEYTVINETKLTITDYSNLILGQEVMLDTTNVDFNGTYSATGPRLRFSNPNWDGVPQNAYYISFGGVVGRSQNYSISYYASDQSFISYTRLTTASTYNFVIYEYITNGAYYINNTFGAEFIEYQLLTENGTLDNAFEYSVNQFITNNNFGKLNFFNWFTSLFFENNAKANTYMQFANWYMNYALLISLAYILFMVLMWFINFVRKLLDKGMSFGEGSY